MVPEGPESRLGMSEKVIRLHQTLEEHGIPHAFGGAIAVDYYRIPRATIDIDLNVFVAPDQRDGVLDALAAEFELGDREEIAAEIAERDQGKAYWGDTRIDLFFAAFDFHRSMAKRIRSVSYEGGTIPILSAEDIVTMKTIFDRAQDWADIEAVCKLRGGDLDTAYMRRWLDEIVGPGDPRTERLMDFLEETS